MEKQLDILLGRFLDTYPDALGVSFHSMELPMTRHRGSHGDILEKYKDISMMSLDDALNTSFSFIITTEGSIIVFFIAKLHFVSVFTKSTSPNKELAHQMHDAFNEPFEQIIRKLA